MDGDRGKARETSWEAVLLGGSGHGDCGWWLQGRARRYSWILVMSESRT
jgi:hypothetical protein